jgi:hypothetical protein
MKYERGTSGAAKKGGENKKQSKKSVRTETAKNNTLLTVGLMISNKLKKQQVSKW